MGASQAAQDMLRFKVPSASDARLAAVQMTRPLYAQLLGQRFYPPKPFERVKWMQGAVEGTADWKHRDVGMKLVCRALVSYCSELMIDQMCGFEMLYQDTKSQLKTTSLNRNVSQHIPITLASIMILICLYRYRT